MYYDALLKAHHIAREMLNDHPAGARINKRVLLFTNRDAPLKPVRRGPRSIILHDLGAPGYHPPRHRLIWSL